MHENQNDIPDYDRALLCLLSLRGLYYCLFFPPGCDRYRIVTFRSIPS